MRVRVLGYNTASRSAKAIACGLVGLRIRTEGSSFRQREDDFIINWGRSRVCSNSNTGEPIVPSLNSYESVAVAANKLSTFMALQLNGVTVPSFYTNKAEAEEIKAAENVTIVERHTLTGHSGEGIRIVSPDDELTNAPLYVRYIPKRAEYRVHVVKGKVIDVQVKRRSRSVPDDQVNWQVRNHQNGFIYARDDIDIPYRALSLAVKAVESLGLDFGAVDLIIASGRGDSEFENGTPVVLEVNTACGVEGTTLDNYLAAFTAIMDGRNIEMWIPYTLESLTVQCPDGDSGEYTTLSPQEFINLSVGESDDTLFDVLEAFKSLRSELEGQEFLSASNAVHLLRYLLGVRGFTDVA